MKGKALAGDRSVNGRRQIPPSDLGAGAPGGPSVLQSERNCACEDTLASVGGTRRDAVQGPQTTADGRTHRHITRIPTIVTTRPAARVARRPVPQRPLHTARRTKVSQGTNKQAQKTSFLIYQIEREPMMNIQGAEGSCPGKFHLHRISRAGIQTHKPLTNGQGLGRRPQVYRVTMPPALLLKSRLSLTVKVRWRNGSVLVNQGPGCHG